MIIIIIILLLLLLLLFYVLVLNMSNLANFEFVALDIMRKNYLYWILNGEIHLDTMGLGGAIKEINKTFKKLICYCNNNIVKRDFIDILNLFHVFLWLKK